MPFRKKYAAHGTGFRETVISKRWSAGGCCYAWKGKAILSFPPEKAHPKIPFCTVRPLNLLRWTKASLRPLYRNFHLLYSGRFVGLTLRGFLMASLPNIITWATPILWENTSSMWLFFHDRPIACLAWSSAAWHIVIDKIIPDYAYMAISSFRKSNLIS